MGEKFDNLLCAIFSGNYLISSIWILWPLLACVWLVISSLVPKNAHGSKIEIILAEEGTEAMDLKMKTIGATDDYARNWKICCSILTKFNSKDNFCLKWFRKQCCINTLSYHTWAISSVSYISYLLGRPGLHYREIRSKNVRTNSDWILWLH